MTSGEMPKPPRPGKAETDQAKQAVKNQAPDKNPDNDKPDQGKRPDQLTSENDGGSQG